MRLLDLQYIGTTRDSDSFKKIDLQKQFELPLYPHVGSFGVTRKHDVHSGVDLYAPVGTSVFALEDGIVVDCSQYTGEEVGSPWWNTTFVVRVASASGVLIYGEIRPDFDISIGKPVMRGKKLGTVMQVLKEDKGRPMSMLHFALRPHGVLSSPDWLPGAAQPREALNCTSLLYSYLRK